MNHNWAIVDDNGVIDQGSETMIRDLWWAYKNRPDDFAPWHGDLRLVEIHELHR